MLPAGEREAHRVLEWVPGVSVFYNLGTSVYFAFQGCKATASTRALEAAEDLGYAGLAALTGGLGGPVAMGVQMGLQPGIKAGVRALIGYFTSAGEPSPVPTAHSEGAHRKVTYERDPLVAETPLLEQRLQEQLTHLLKRSLAYSMIFKKWGQHREGRGSRGSPDPPFSRSAFTTTLPFVIISNNNQFSSAWASILWFNMLSSDPKPNVPSLGFVSRKQEKKLLKSKRTGTFLLRFSESVLGGVTFTWVEHHEKGSPTFHAVDPYTASELVSLALPDIIRDYQMMVEENIPENPLKFLYPNTARDEAFGPYYSQRQEGTLSDSQKYLNRRLIRVSSRQPSKWQTEEELVVATENLETLQLQPGGQGTQQAGGLALPQPQSSGTPQGTPGSLGTLQGVATSPGTLQVTPGSLGTLQGVATSPGTLQVMATSPGVPQVTPGSLGTLQGVATSPGTLQVMATSPGLPQVTPGSLGTLQGVASRLGIAQVVATSPETLQVTPGILGTPQVTATSPGTLQPTGLGLLQAQPQNLEPPRVASGAPNIQGTLQVAPGAVGTVQVLPAGLGVLQVGSGDLGTLQGQQGTRHPGTPRLSWESSALLGPFWDPQTYSQYPRDPQGHPQHPWDTSGTPKQILSIPETLRYPKIPRGIPSISGTVLGPPSRSSASLGPFWDPQVHPQHLWNPLRYPWTPQGYPSPFLGPPGTPGIPRGIPQHPWDPSGTPKRIHSLSGTPRHPRDPRIHPQHLWDPRTSPGPPGLSPSIPGNSRHIPQHPRDPRAPLEPLGLPPDSSGNPKHIP
ncbi:PREDICTED: nascent polypeptide-associated complex subunit alpha, muscle-specific form-like [Ficedula albicollis]|uniref:nascent polypeptide-associated complex subunit alpha, muscle-specific form-like n=1 Tax=Ficedula albicollis TaxID=59894 RepID=UPI0007AD903B|nr:PREDICTED: nascent polypeptide-associated complex subunit alpha, muscle-specific form-like [Ficedula albicollis]